MMRRRPAGTLVLDVDDTLVATFRVGLRKCQEVARRLGLPPPAHIDLAALYGRMSFPDCIRRIHPGVDIAAYQAAYDALVDTFPAEPLGDGSRLVAAARAAGLGIGVLTNGPGAKTARKLATAGIDQHDLDFMFHGDNTAAPKPAGAAFRQLVIAAGVDPARSWYVSDAAADWQGCETAGFGSVGVATALASGRGFVPRVLVPDIDRLVELVPVLASIDAPKPGRPAAVTFDAGFTLIEHVLPPEAVVASRFAERGIAAPIDEVPRAMAAAAPLLTASESWWSSDIAATTRLEAFYGAVAASFGATPADAAAREIVAAYTAPPNWRAVPGARKALEALRQTDWPVGVLANWQSSLPDVLAATGLGDLVDCVMPSTLTGAAKPAAAAFAAVAAALSVEGRTIVHVGDDVVADAAGALHAGWRAALVPRGALPDTLRWVVDVLCGSAVRRPDDPMTRART